MSLKNPSYTLSPVLQIHFISHCYSVHFFIFFPRIIISAIFVSPYKNSTGYTATGQTSPVFTRSSLEGKKKVIKWNEIKQRNPAIITRAVYADIKGLQGVLGCRSIITKDVEIFYGNGHSWKIIRITILNLWLRALQRNSSNGALIAFEPENFST